MGFDTDSHFILFINYGTQGTEFNGINTHFTRASRTSISHACNISEPDQYEFHWPWHSVYDHTSCLNSNGLSQVLKAHVRSSNSWANYPKEKRSSKYTSLRLCSEEILQNTVQDKLLTCLNSNDILCGKCPYSEIFWSAFCLGISPNKDCFYAVIALLKLIASTRRTNRKCLYAFFWLVIFMIRFIKAAKNTIGNFLLLQWCFCWYNSLPCVKALPQIHSGVLDQED